MGLRQMLVCYECILTGESRAFCSEIRSEDARGRPLLEKREKGRTPSYFSVSIPEIRWE